MITTIPSLLLLAGLAQCLPTSCQSQKCLSTAASILGSIDTRTDPCQDFYQFSCGAWSKIHEIPDNLLEIGAFEALSRGNSESLRKMLQNGYNDLKLQNASNEVPGNQTLGNIFEENREDVRAAVTKGIAYLIQFGTTPLFTFAAHSEMSHPETYGVYVLQSGLTLATKERYNDSSVLEAYEKAASETWHKISGNVQLPGVNSENDMYHAVERAVDFEKQLSLISNSSQELSNPVTIYNPVTVTKLNEMAPMIDWDLLISLLRQN
ncbi:hypothetical protein BC943DRAFT_353554, partial [Umbelopsis sp. AD052]